MPLIISFSFAFFFSSSISSSYLEPGLWMKQQVIDNQVKNHGGVINLDLEDEVIGEGLLNLAALDHRAPGGFEDRFNLSR